MALATAHARMWPQQQAAMHSRHAAALTAVHVPANSWRACRAGASLRHPPVFSKRSATRRRCYYSNL